MSHADMLNAYVDSLLAEAPAAPESVRAAPRAVVVPPAEAPRPLPPPLVVAPPAKAAPVKPVPVARPVPVAAPATTPTVPAMNPEFARLFVPPPAAPDVRTEQATRWLCFLLAQQAYAVEVKKVQEVVRVPDIAAVVGANPDTVGVMNLRGQIVQVVSLRQRLSLGAAAPSPDRRVVVLEEDGIVLGLLVDAVAEVFAANADAIHESGLVHGALPADWFRGLLRRGNDLVVALDASRLLAH
jgi:purine-binding chemotaxis protein CheW